MRRRLVTAYAFAVVTLLSAGGVAQAAHPHHHAAPPAHAHGPKSSATVSVFATGFNNPRGLEFGPDGSLYVAEGGLGGTTSTTPAQCQQVPAPVGPYSGSNGDPVRGGRISKVAPNGAVTQLVTGLPSSQTSPASGSLPSGVADVAFLHGQLYALISGAGCSHGVPTVPNEVIRVNANGTTTMVADLSAFLAAHPVAHPNPPDFEPDGTWYSMVAARGALYVVEPNHGEIDRVTPSGTITRVVDVSATLGHAVPTALAYHGVFYAGTLGEFEGDQAGDEHLLQITPNGRLRVRSSGLEKVIGLAFRGGQLYALELSSSANGPTPGTGRIVRVQNHRVTVVASGMTFPTGMTTGPDGALYVSERGFGAPAGAGRVLRVTVR